MRGERRDSNRWLNNFYVDLTNIFVKIRATKTMKFKDLETTDSAYYLCAVISESVNTDH